MDLGKVGIWTNEIDRLPNVEARDVLQEIEGLGYGSLWVGESSRRREALVNSALLLSMTERLVIATGVASIWARDAASTASAQRVLCEAFPHRFLLGLGVSHEGPVKQRGHDYDRPYEAMRRYLRGIDVHPAGDLPDPPEPPMRVLGAQGPRMLELARDHANGAHPFLVPPEHTAMARGILGPGRFLIPEQGVLLEEDADVARSILRAEMKGRLGYPNYRDSLLRMGFTDKDFEGDGSDALIDRLFAWGSVADIGTRVNEHLQAGADGVALYVLRADKSGVPLTEWRELSALV